MVSFPGHTLFRSTKVTHSNLIKAGDLGTRPRYCSGICLWQQKACDGYANTSKVGKVFIITNAGPGIFKKEIPVVD